jgi:hypothetical protein
MPLGAARFGLSGADLGKLELIETQTVSSVSNINFTNLKGSTYNVHLITANDVTFTSSGNNMSIRVSNDGGSTYESGSDYDFAIQWASQVAGFNEYRTTGYTQFDIGLLGGFGSTMAQNWYAYMYNANDSSKYTFWTSHGTSHSATASHGQGMFFGSGVYDVAETVNAFRLFGDGGNTIANATISLYGIKE